MAPADAIVPTAADVDAAPLSKGSLGHPESCGLPCKYFWKPRGCKDGANCARCHLCPWQPLLARGGSGKSVAGKAAVASKAAAAGAVAKAAAAPPREKPAIQDAAEPAATATGPMPGRTARNPASQTRDERLYANALRYKDLTDEELEKILPRREDDGRITSIGSLLHAEMQCTRCIYFETPKGCPNGMRCKFCHMKHSVKEQGQKRGAEEEPEGAREAKAARTAAPASLCDEQGNSRPSWLRNEEPPPAPLAHHPPPAVPGWGCGCPPPAAAYGWPPPPMPGYWPPPAWGAPAGAAAAYPQYCRPCWPPAPGAPPHWPGPHAPPTGT